MRDPLGDAAAGGLIGPPARRTVPGWLALVVVAGGVFVTFLLANLILVDGDEPSSRPTKVVRTVEPGPS